MSAGQFQDVARSAAAEAVPRALRESARAIVGRRWVLRRVHDWLANGTERYFLLTGEPGAGKSTIAAWLAEPPEPEPGPGPEPSATQAPGGDPPELAEVRAAVDARHFCTVRGGAGSVDPRRFTELMAAQLASRHEEFARAVASSLRAQYNVRLDVRENWGTAVGVQVQNLFVTGATVADAFHAAVSRPLRTLAASRPGSRVLILVDGLDEALIPSFPGIVNLLSGDADLPGGVRLLLTSRNERRVVDRFLDRAEGCRRLDLSSPAAAEDNSRDLRAYVGDRIGRAVGGPAPRRPGDGALALALEQIVSRSAGNFLYTTMLLDEIADGRREVTDMSGLPTGLYALYRSSLLRLMPDAQQLGRGDVWLEHYRPLLGGLSAAAAPVPVEVLAGWTGRDRGELLARLDDLQQMVRYDREFGGYRLYHSSVADFLGARFADDGTESFFHIPAAAEHERVVGYYLDRAAKDGWAVCDAYGLAHLPHHLAAWARAAAVDGETGGEGGSGGSGTRDPLRRGPRTGELAARARRLYELVADPAYTGAQWTRFRSAHATAAAFRAALEVAATAQDAAATGRLVDLLAVSPHVELRGLAVEALVGLHPSAPGHATAKIRQLLGGTSPDGWSVAVKAARDLPSAARDVFRWIALEGSPGLRQYAVYALYLRWAPEPGNLTADLLDDLSREVRLSRPLRSRRLLEFLADLSITVYINHCDDPSVARATSDLWHRLIAERLHLTALAHPLLGRGLGSALSRMFGQRVLDGALNSEFQDPMRFFGAPAEAKALFRGMIRYVDPDTDAAEALDGLTALFRSDVTLFRNLAQVIVAVHAYARPEPTLRMLAVLAGRLDPPARLWLLLSFSVLLPDTPPAWIPLLEELTAQVVTAAEPERISAEAGLPPTLDIALLPLGLAYGKAGGPMPAFTGWLRDALAAGDHERAGRLLAGLAPVALHHPQAVFATLREAAVPLAGAPLRSATVAAFAVVRTLHTDQVDGFLTRNGAAAIVPDVRALSDVELVRRQIALVGYFNNVVHQAVRYPRMRHGLLIPCFRALVDADGPAEFIRRFTPVPLSMLRDSQWRLIEWTRPR